MTKYNYDGYDRRLKLLLAMSAYYCELTDTELHKLDSGITKIIMQDNIKKKHALVLVLYYYAGQINWLMQDTMKPVIKDVPPLTLSQERKYYKQFGEWYENVCHETLAKYNKNYRK